MFATPAQLILTIDFDKRSSARQQKVWFTLGLGFAAAGLATVPTKAACAPAMATEAPVRLITAVLGLRVSCASTANAQLAAAQPVNLAGAPLPIPKIDYQIVFVLGGPGSGKGTQVLPYWQLCSCSGFFLNSV